MEILEIVLLNITGIKEVSITPDRLGDQLTVLHIEGLGVAADFPAVQRLSVEQTNPAFPVRRRLGGERIRGSQCDSHDSHEILHR